MALLSLLMLVSIAAAIETPQPSAAEETAKAVPTYAGWVYRQDPDADFSHDFLLLFCATMVAAAYPINQNAYP